MGRAEPVTGRIRITVFVLGAAAALPATAAGQRSRLYAGGGPTLVSQPHSDADPLGGTTWGGSLSVGGWVSRRLALESELSFGGRYAWKYTYRPGPSWTADVVTSRRDTYFSFLLRSRMGPTEPIAGVSYAYGRIARHATTAGRPYFDDAGSNNGIAAVGGLDAPIEVAPRFDIVPGFRALIVARAGGSRSAGSFDPLGEQTRTGPFVFRLGVGGRVTF